MSKIGLFWRTVRHLKTRQLIYQVWNRWRGRPILRLQKTAFSAYLLTVPDADKPLSWQNRTFTFLNQSVCFPQQIDWNYRQNGKLWTYHLNYFDFLNQPGLTVEEGLKLIHDFIAQTDFLRDGLEPYPTSLRITNWIQFLSRNQIQNHRINHHLFAQSQVLSRRLEYHLAGNHLLENGFALLTAALYFRHERWFRKASRLICAELTTQILADGGHDERSPMYHQLLLDRLLTVLLMLQHDPWHTDLSFVVFLSQKATLMLDWLSAITFRNGHIPMVNDAALGMALTTVQLREKAKTALRLAGHSPIVFPRKIRQQDETSGYRMFRRNRFELFADVGPVGPDHQPGHAHADTFSFVLYVDNAPVIVDSGTSTYQPGERRMWERSTAAHNTVEVMQTNSSEVWAGFRVGRRAQTTVLTNTETTLTARHGGYRPMRITHERTWLVEPAKVRIVDRLLNFQNKTRSGLGGVARFYVHPTIQVQVIGEVVVAGPLQLLFSSVTNLKINVTTCAMAGGFNQLRWGRCLEVAFTSSLETTLTLLDEHTLPDVLF